jgi:glycosyltransferase involved in cell wall biosynthesis
MMSSASIEMPAAALRVLAVTNLFPSPVEPQRAPYNRQQFAALARRAVVRVLVPVFWYQWRPFRFPDSDYDGVEARYFPFFYPPRVLENVHGSAMRASLVATQLRAARRFKPDVLLASWLHPDAYGAVGLARRLAIPLVAKAHGSDANVLSDTPARRREIAAVLRQASGIVAVSEALRSKLIELGAPAQLTRVVYNGVDRIRFSPGARDAACARSGLDPALHHILYVGNLKVSKGCEDLIRAFARFASAASPNARLVFAGDGPHQARIKSLAAGSGLDDRIRFLGTTSHEQLPDLYRAAEVVCLPSHSEGVPNVLLEAMACGTPIVATRVGGIPEVVPACAGVLIEPRDTAALAQALASVRARTWDRDAIVEHARRFDWSESAAQLERILVRAARGEAPDLASDCESAAPADGPSRV